MNGKTEGGKERWRDETMKGNPPVDAVFRLVRLDNSLAQIAGVPVM